MEAGLEAMESRHAYPLAAMLAAAAALLILIAPGAAPQDAAPLSPQQLAALLDRVTANQHRNDEALDRYERIERYLALRSDSSDPAAVKEDRTYRVVPHAAGSTRLLLEDQGKRTPPEVYRQSLAVLETELVRSLNPDARQRTRVERREKRARESYETVEAARRAFRATFLGREVRNGRVFVKVQLDPRPDFKSTNRTTAAFQHVRVIAWIDEAAAQLARAEAEIMRDISFGGGVLGKVYRGGRFVLEQAPVDDVWLPTCYQFDIRGRRFLFGFQVHDRIEARDYRPVPPPQQMLALVRQEMNGGRPAPDP